MNQMVDVAKLVLTKAGLDPALVSDVQLDAAMFEVFSKRTPLHTEKLCRAYPLFRGERGRCLGISARRLSYTGG